MGIMDSATRIHVIGAGGIGVSAVARLLKHEGKQVTGSDGSRSETVEELIADGIPVTVGHRAENLPAGTDLVVYSGAVPVTNPERIEATRRGVPQMTYFQFVGEFSKERWTIAVSGTNGKSTTTAMLGLMLERGGLDPTVIVGSKVPSFPNRNLRLGKSKYLVVEACEHEANILKLSPRMIVLTNIEEDHLDFYRDLAHIRDTFKEYVHKLPANGKLVLNADDKVSQRLEPAVHPVTYGIAHKADYVAGHIVVGSGVQTFRITHARDGAKDEVGDFALAMPGRFNVQNALAAVTAALELGVSVDAIRSVLREFTGIWRRFERVGTHNGATVISDYGHHPTAVRGTIEAARSFYPGRRIVMAFQPHQRNRTRNLFDEFVPSFDDADVLLLSEIFDVAGREDSADADVSSRQLVEAIRKHDDKRGTHRRVLYVGALEETLAAITKTLLPDDVLILAGAGDIYTLAKRLTA